MTVLLVVLDFFKKLDRQKSGKSWAGKIPGRHLLSASFQTDRIITFSIYLKENKSEIIKDI